jgi:hypothetical protein
MQKNSSKLKLHPMEQIKIRTAVGLYLAAILFILSCMMTSCAGTKALEKSAVRVDSVAKSTYDASEQTHKATESEYQRQIKEMEELDVTVQQSGCDTNALREKITEAFIKSNPCNGTIDSSVFKKFADSLIKAVNAAPPKVTTVKKLPDGTVEISGEGITKVRDTKSKTDDQSASFKSEITTLTEQHRRDSTALVKSQFSKQKTVKRSMWWLWMIIGAVVWEVIRRSIPKIPFLNFKSTNMKSVIVFVLCSLMLTSCGHYNDGTSVWAKQMWTAPIAFSILGLVLIENAYKGSKSGSKINPLFGGGEGGNVPIYQFARFWMGIVCIVAAIVIVIAVNADI